jgi:hypothetical protein
MIRERRKIFGQMLVDVVKYILTIIVIGNIFTTTINPKQTAGGIFLAGVIAYIAYRLIPKDREEGE